MSQLLVLLISGTVSWAPAGLVGSSSATEDLALPCPDNRPSALRYVYDNPYGPNPHGPNPVGPDPHGLDPHDEQHDPGLPANKEQAKYQYRTPKDIYGQEQE